MTYQDYLRMGWPVFPVGPDKKPLVRWKDFQSRFPTELEILDWEKKFPSAGIGCPTGPFSKLFVIDVDGDRGLTTQATLNYPLPPTRISKTPRGYHYFFNWNARMEKYITTISDIQPGIDIRGKGGYVIVPSVHMPGREWKLTETIVDLPEPWYDVIPHTTSSNGKEPLNIADKITGLSDGNRHDSFMRLIGKLMSAKLEAHEVIATLMPLAVEQKFEQDLLDLVTDMFQRYQIVPKGTIKAGLASDILSAPEPVLEWLIESVWVNQSCGLIAGIPGVGKTWIALDMLFAVATGSLCLGKYRVMHSAPVLLVEEEGTFFGLSRRLHMLARGRQLTADKLANFHHMTRQFVNIVNHEKELIQFVKTHGIKFIVFDSMREVHSADENSSEQMKPVLNSFSRLSLETGASVLLIHHLRKESGGADKRPVFERMRGSSAIHGWRDCVLGIEGEEQSSLAKCTFQFRDAESSEPITIKRNYDGLNQSLSLMASTLVESEVAQDKLQAMIEYLRAHGASFKDHLCQKVGGRKGENIRVFNHAVKTGLVVKNGFKWDVPE